MPQLVQEAAIDNISDICSRANEPRLAMAHYNLACSFVNGIGVEYSLEKAATHILDAAKLGLPQAQSVYVDIFCNFLENPNIDQETLQHWIEASTIRRSLNKADKSSKLYSSILKQRRSELFAPSKRRLPTE